MRKNTRAPASGPSPRTPAPSKRHGESHRAEKTPKPGTGRTSSRIVDPDHERGVPYPGDIPNPLAGKYRGCF